jgi:hypothetical protein
MTLSSRAHALYEAFPKPGCPVCRLTLDSVHHHLDSLIYEYVNKPATHEAVRAARGFCPKHAWHVQDEINASALGIAVLYEGVIRHLLDDMGTVPANGGRRHVSQAESALQPRGACPACEHQARVEDHLLRNLLSHITQPQFAEGFRGSAGLCLPHLRILLEQKGSAEQKAQVLAIQQEIWRTLQGQLAEFIRKHDYRFTAEGMGEEGSSPRRSIEALSGQKGLR